MSVWIAETLIASTLLMALVMLLRRPVARWLGAGAAYWLWLLPLARMALPPLPQDVASPSPFQLAVEQAGLPSLLDAGPNILVQPEWTFPWLEIAASLWLVGFVLFLAAQAVGYVRFRRFILKGATAIGEEGRIRIVTSPQAGGPLAFGVLRPTIVLPADFAVRFDGQEQAMAIAHEKAHHQGGDLAANMVALLLLGLHWCNPVAWIAYRAYRADQEQACDARVLALHGTDQAHIYGRAILKAAGGRRFAGACHLNRITALKGRLKMLSAHEMSLRRISWGMAAVALVTVSGLVLTASGSRAARQVAAITEKVDAMNFGRLADLVAQPASASEFAPPEPPAAPAMVQPLSHTDAQVERDSAPPAPPVPPAPVADMAPPVPPVPPVPEIGLRDERSAIPSEAEIRRMVPHVDVANGCEDGKGVSQRETVDADGRRHIRVRICEAQISAQAHRAARAGLIAARAQIAAAVKMSDKIKADVLRDLDKEIAQMDGEE
ncbi:peptidase M56 BlaR1 [Sphingobium chlorophenolicum L-1]|uniref:Peptidase M56 BlaR1 n=1 Tax=Sphingobium chlorophenolicum L-1 TaxID=690566 RepID=F6ETR0_SPHCR|nr:M56 family metallopeptidase [Sphingobium chlorophenolicum]AEG50485.1 peptidase M56 BlaR1 [Sphingobium chlorophenolicum L-1]